jgi:hypothetical protein
MRKRSVWVEPLFGEAKEFHRLRRFRLRRLRKVNIEGVMVAAGQNLKRLIKHHLAFFFSQIHLCALSFPSNPDFSNRLLLYCANNSNSAFSPLLFVCISPRVCMQNSFTCHSPEGTPLRDGVRSEATTLAPDVIFEML